MDPKIMLVVGIRTSEVERKSVVEGDTHFRRQVTQPYPGAPEEVLPSGYLDSVLYWGDLSEFSLESPGEVVGYIVNSVPHDSPVARALMHLVPREKWFSSYVLELERWEGERQNRVSNLLDLTRINPENRNVEFFGGTLSVDTHIWWEFACRLLRIAGWNVSRANLRAFLVMEWE